MELADLGYPESFDKFRVENNLTEFETGRVIAEHKERYIIKSPSGEFEAEITGNMRYSAESREDFPAVGDWVAFIGYEHDIAVIHKIYPRYSLITRQAAGGTGELQLIAANIDYAFLVQSVDRDFNINRLERYLAICYSSKVNPLIVLTKTDLIDDHRLSEIIAGINARISGVPVIAVSNETLSGIDILAGSMIRGKTYCMLGSSGAGKSTLLNNLSGRNLMKTGAISDSTNKGRHITSHRELIMLENGSLLIDNPGMREVGIADASGGIESAFDSIIEYAANCRYKDCTHMHEAGCAVLQAIEEGSIDKASYDNYRKMMKENAFFLSTAEERKRKDKALGKLLKNYKKEMKNRKNL